MFLVETIWDEAKEIFGHCNEKKLLRWISDAIQLLANKGEIDPLVGFLDICTCGKCVTLPREVATVLAVNIGGHPTLGHDQIFSFHLNGPGDCCTPCGYDWYDTGSFPTYRDLQCPSKLIAFLDNQEDEGKLLRVFGFDEQNRPLRTKVGNNYEDGYRVPTIFGFALPESDAPKVSRITDIVKDVTVGNIRLSSFDNSTFTGTLLGIYEHDETYPRYRRIRLGTNCGGWVRIMYRRSTYELRSQKDRILLHSRPALMLALHAIQKYRESDLVSAVQFEVHATRLLTEQESVLTSPVSSPIQVNDRNSIKLCDQID